MKRWIFALLLVASAVAVSTTSLPAQQPVASTPVLLAAREIPRGALIEAADIDGIGDEAESILGWETKRVIRTGEVLRAPAIAPAQIIRSGETVQLLWRGGELEIRMTGRAMGSAIGGERILVRVDTRRRFEGIAEAPGVVRLDNLEKGR